MCPDAINHEGVVVEINISPRNEQLPEPVERVRAVPAHGLEGDRYFASEPREEAERDRDLTLIATEALEALTEETGIELTAAASRRNVLTAASWEATSSAVQLASSVCPVRSSLINLDIRFLL